MDVEAINHWVDIDVTNWTLDFLSDLDFSAGMMRTYTTIPQLNLPISWDEIVMCGSNLYELLEDVHFNYAMLSNLFL